MLDVLFISLYLMTVCMLVMHLGCLVGIYIWVLQTHIFAWWMEKHKPKHQTRQQSPICFRAGQNPLLFRLMQYDILNDNLTAHEPYKTHNLHFKYPHLAFRVSRILCLDVCHNANYCLDTVMHILLGFCFLVFCFIFLFIPNSPVTIHSYREQRRNVFFSEISYVKCSCHSLSFHDLSMTITFVLGPFNSCTIWCSHNSYTYCLKE